MKLKCVLLIDDDHATNVYHTVIIRRTQFTENLQVIERPEIALDFLTSLIKREGMGEYRPQQIPELIFLDVNMPKLTGVEFLEKYQEIQANFAVKPVVIMLTTHLHDSDEKKCLSFDCVKGIIKKPLIEDNLAQILKEHFSFAH